MANEQPIITRQTVIRVAAWAGVDPKTAARHLKAPNAPLTRRGGGHHTRQLVLRAARELGVPLPAATP
jgi:hypothetical protein